MAITPVELLQNRGFKPRKPLAERTRDRLFSKLGSKVPVDLASFYASCNGGTLSMLECRFYPLAEAVDLLGAYDFITMFDFLPLFVSEHQESDPCMVALSGPLKGFVYYHPHDATMRVLAPSIKAFAQALAKKDPETFELEYDPFLYPKELSAREQKATASLLEMSHSDDIDSDDTARLEELALSLLLPDEQNAAKNTLKNAEDKFIDRLIAILKKAGIPAKRDAVYGMRVGPDNEPVNVKSFKQDQNRPDFENYFVERIRDVFLEE